MNQDSTPERPRSPAPLARRRSIAHGDDWLPRLAGVVAWGIGLSMLWVTVILVVEASRSLAGVPDGPTGASMPPIRGTVGPTVFGGLPSGWAVLQAIAARAFPLLLILVPAGVLSGVFLAEQASSPRPGARWLRGAFHGVAGVPGLVFGALGGVLLSVPAVLGSARQGVDAASAAAGPPALSWVPVSLALVSLAPVVTASEQALRSIPRSWRASAIALGASRLQVLFHLLVPNALPGIAGGVLQAISRASAAWTLLLLVGVALTIGQASGLDGLRLGALDPALGASDPSTDGGVARRALPMVLGFLVSLSAISGALGGWLRSRTLPTPPDRD